ncbi:hypothetical protein MMC10_006331 [Thelotrema lepadinum]|nr:hypothetical protein [Thelotrema lepadinum]
MSFFDPRKDTSPPTVSYADVMSSQDGLKVWIELICRYGFCFVEGCPIDPVATEELLKRISYIRHTHYGGFYDFTSDLALKDTAYTEVALEPHTDTTYFTDPAGLQMFHLLSHTGGGGGYSILLDGFRAARRLLEYSPEDFRVLCNFEVPYHASGNEGISITPSIGSSPVLRGRLDFNFKDDSALTSILPYQIRWNDSDRGDMPIYPSPLPWYRAAKLWRDILKDPDLEYRFQLQPGTALSKLDADISSNMLRYQVFDNWRMLHGRSEFTGARRMCGGYSKINPHAFSFSSLPILSDQNVVNMDDFQSQWKILSLGSREILERI